ncbi:hypothetical protein QKV95_gp059 [Poseidoniales virus YSH_150918]|uniref:Uncharacterized protein n=1 Tax=Poseidoniales virus YSH_150918 TaxID=3071324 RepID=A0A976UAX6_9CAUD|nr:hypothetical protein QKV95_gp059 [Yangshan Harbor Poseidoniales virus]UVF62533.1 hypothetical protein [Poseidoniales virus YSH_150918]
MNFIINNKKVLEILKKMDVKKELTDDIIIKKSGNGITFYNGDAITIVSHFLEVEAEGDESSYILDGSELSKYLSKLNGDVLFTFGDSLILSQNNNEFHIPLIDRHAFSEEFYNTNMLNVVPNSTLESCSLKFEGRFTIPYADFSSALELCFITGDVVSVSLTPEEVSFFSSRAGRISSLSFAIEDFVGEEASVNFSGKIDSFFKGEENLTFFLKDDYPLLIVSDNCKMLRAPRVDNE